jgi:ubiquinone/menaquinone biosynthesis C-methylase UbiE
MMASRTTLDWYEGSYKAEGINAQRRYPNEELVRFLARNFFKLTREERGRVSILDAGCGPCSNLWVVAREGFDAHGVDLSPESLRLGREILTEWGVMAQLKVGNLLRLPYADQDFDAVLDVFSSYVLNMAEFKDYLAEVARVLKVGGKFFLFTSSAGSDAFQNHAPATKIDEFTLNGIYRKGSPYYGNFYPFRFSDVASLDKLLRSVALRPCNVERVTRTYNQMAENFQFISLEACREQ